MAADQDREEQQSGQVAKEQRHRAERPPVMARAWPLVAPRHPDGGEQQRQTHRDDEVQKAPQQCAIVSEQHEPSGQYDNRPVSAR